MDLKLIMLFSMCFVWSLFGAEKSTVPDSTSQNKTKEFLQRLIQESKTEAIQELEKKNVKDSQDSLEKGADGLEIDGLIINETKTKIGQDFYEFFYNSWEAPQNIFGYTLFISERPAGQMGSWVWINVDEVTVYQDRLTPKPDEIELSAQNAVTLVISFLINQQNNQKQMAGDEMAGTGIF